MILWICLFLVYYINAADDGDTIIKCDGKSRECEIITKPSNDDTCSSSKDPIGELRSDGNGEIGVCAAYPLRNPTDTDSFYHLITFVNPESLSDRYLVGHNSDTIFGFDQDNDVTYYALEVSENAITFDNNYNSPDDQSVLCMEGKIVNRLIDFCSPYRSGNYYNCTLGKCTSRYWSQIDTLNLNDYSGKFIYFFFFNFLFFLIKKIKNSFFFIKCFLIYLYIILIFIHYLFSWIELTINY